jgi:hypothetical protein
MLYAAKCFWPGVSASEFERDAAPRLSLARSGSAHDPAYLGSLVFGEDELVLCLYEGSSPATVLETARRAHVPCERIMESAWLPAMGAPLTKSGGLT